MLEITTTRHNPLVDPHLAVWSWEIPVYLFLGGIVAGMMMLAGVNLIRHRPRRRPEELLLGADADPRDRAPDAGHGRALPRPRAQALRVARLRRLRADLADVVGLVGAAPRLPASPRRVGAHALPDAWPWLARTCPACQRLRLALRAPGRDPHARLGERRCSASRSASTPGILLNTMVARPLWNSAILGPLFLLSGLSAGAALIHLATATLPGRPAPRGLVGGAFAALWQPVGREAPPRSTADS